MYGTLLQVDFQVSIFLFLVWLATTVATRLLTTRSTQRRMRRWARISLVLAAVGLLLTAARWVFTAVLASSFGWQIIADRKLLTVVLATVPAIVVALFTVPRLLRMARTAAPDSAPSAEARAAATSLWTLVPVRVALVGTALGLFEVFLPPARLGPVFLLTVSVLLVLAVTLLWWAHRRRAAGVPRAPRGRRIAVRAAVTAVVLAAGAAVFVTSMRASAFPDTYNMMQGVTEFGGGSTFPQTHEGGISVETLTGPRDRQPDRSFTLTAQAAKVPLTSGATVEAWTFNGQVPGPELRVREGELVEIKLVNNIPSVPVTIHWHGVDVPNAEDGVPGMTQNAVRTGQTHTYRFVADEVGTRWYHSHQLASEQVGRGLFGALVIEPRTVQRPVDEDIAVPFHIWDASSGARRAFGAADALERRQMEAGRRVRLRLINTSNKPATFTLTGTPYRVTALDGTDVNGPTEVNGYQLPLSAAGRYDLEFVMPSRPVRLAELGDVSHGLLLQPDGAGDVAPDTEGPVFDPTAYGSASDTPFNASSSFDRTFNLVLDDWLGFYNGKFALRQTVNGRVFPNAPVHMVREGDLVKMRFVNRGTENHPMHLHGHHMLVLSRNGQPVTGSPMVMDTLNVAPGEAWEVGFRADNPGLWMDHCHDFVHTQLGMVLHLAYEGVSTPYMLGEHAHNHPE
ncbi:multicopper oxidase family protein [Asanoa iriomotensis]|uniref:FtsP/CotA-like multicopper oxidase with cupredoxin domain n=1 Tax=Asanoa iriomotensis TaxID=234613 RepID=A0ABQ4C0W4_9ACTN|nr:multicopper oxidase family protein [Asanoa iriomotensis]GIF56419.1 hypothetical protein Air01nite_25140 [Asanoa iriomotensis]